MPPEQPSEPWFAFLWDLEAALQEPTDFHCLGGFVISQQYGFARETADLDILAVIPNQVAPWITELAGRGSALQKKHGVYVDYVGVANYPENYEQRLVRSFPLWGNLRLWALEPHDLALTKLERSNDRDIRDVLYLAKAGLIEERTLLSRFETELEPYIREPSPGWTRTTLQMWIDACWPGQRD